MGTRGVIDKLLETKFTLVVPCLYHVAGCIFPGATFAFSIRGIMLVASYRFRESLSGFITALATSPAVVVAVGAD